MKNPLSYLLILLSLALSTTAFAKPIKKEVSAGRTSAILSYFVYDESRCTNLAPPKIGKLVAENGRLSSKIGSGVKKGGPCNGKRFKTVNIYYKQNSGFRGSDKASATFRFPRFIDGSGGLISRKVKFNITVK